jgi:hypothetical protein
MMLYRYDFCDRGARLNLHGQRRLNELAATGYIWTHHILRIETTPGAPDLDRARRDYVARALAEAGVSARVEIGYPTEVSPFGDETRMVNTNLLRRVQRGRPLGGSSGGGMTGYGASGGGTEGESE